MSEVLTTWRFSWGWIPVAPIPTLCLLSTANHIDSQSADHPRRSYCRLKEAVSAIVDRSVAEQITLVSLSTTLATNALVEGRGRSVALMLIGFTPSQMQRAKLAEALGGDPYVF